MIALENVFRERKYIFHAMILKWFLYVIWICTCPKGEILMTGLENGSERKKIVYFSFWENVGGFRKTEN